MPRRSSPEDGALATRHAPPTRAAANPARLALRVAAPVLLLSMAACDPAPAGPAVVSAMVFDSAGRPLPGVQAELRPLGDSAVVSAVTDSAGQVRLELEARGPGVARFVADPGSEAPLSAYAYLLLEPGEVDLRVRLDRDGTAVEFPPEAPRMARWGRAVGLRTAMERRHRDAYDGWVQAGASGELAPQLAPLADSARSLIVDEKDEEVRAALRVALLVASSRDPAATVDDGDRILDEIPPGAAVWAYSPFQVAGLIQHAAVRAEGIPLDNSPDGAIGNDDPDVAARQQLANRRAAAYLDRVIEAHPEPGVRPRLLLGALRLASTTNRSDEAAGYYERLLAEFPDSYEAEAAADMAPGRQLSVGEPIPDVAFPRLDSTAPPITAAELAGPATLLDFWAVWCPPCLAEIPAIRAAHERFADRGLRVVSVSFDETREKVEAFRDTHPMPWEHAFVGADGLSRGPVAEAYALTGLPYVVLVGPDGKVKALEAELRGERLTKTLERVLGER